MERNIPEQLIPFIGPNTIVVRSPGRINLIGEHTDYNEGFVLPAAIDKAIYVAVEKQEGNWISIHSVDFNESLEIKPDAISPRPGHWATYILGVVDQLKKRGHAISGFRLTIYGDVPLGAGLSSSAAVECGTAFALNEVFNLGVERKELARIAQKAEHEFAGVQCGIMDQFASLMGKKDRVMKLDCRSLDFEYYPLDLQGYNLLLFDSQVKHALASSAYNQRRMECEQGVRLVQKMYPQVKNLRDITLAMLDETVDPNHIVYHRCRFVIEENERVLTGCRDLEKGDIHSFGKKMFASHEGLKNKYDVSCRELDILVNAVTGLQGVIGARMMGGGFGGCTINIIKEENVEKVVNEVAQKYYQLVKRELKTYLAKTENGSNILNH